MLMPHRIDPEISPVTTCIGTVTPATAEQTGLTPSTPLVLSRADIRCYKGWLSTAKWLEDLSEDIG